MIERVISGGQTGADQGGLDAAIELGVPHGGWCPTGRRSEDGPIPARYQMRETTGWDYPSRTKLNIQEADGTVVFTVGEPTGGSGLTLKFAADLSKPVAHIDLHPCDEDMAIDRICDFIDVFAIKTLNVAGSRESKEPGIQKAVSDIMSCVLREMASQ